MTKGPLGLSRSSPVAVSISFVHILLSLIIKNLQKLQTVYSRRAPHTKDDDPFTGVCAQQQMLSTLLSHAYPLLKIHHLHCRANIKREKLNLIKKNYISFSRFLFIIFFIHLAHIDILHTVSGCPKNFKCGLL